MPDTATSVADARWVARARYHVMPGNRSDEQMRMGGDPSQQQIWSELVRLGVLVPREANEIGLAEEFLWRVRNRLHAHAGRRSDRLTFDEQETIALELGYASPSAFGIARAGPIPISSGSTPAVA